eukprot:524595_1
MSTLQFVLFLLSFGHVRSQCDGNIKQYAVNWPGILFKEQYCITECTNEATVQPMSCVADMIYACKIPDGDSTIIKPEFFTITGNGAMSKADVVDDIIILPVQHCKFRKNGKPYTKSEYNRAATLYHELKAMVQNWEYLTERGSIFNRQMTTHDHLKPEQTTPFNDAKDGKTLIAPIKIGTMNARAFRFADALVNDKYEIRTSYATKNEPLFKLMEGWQLYELPKQFHKITDITFKATVPGELFFEEMIELDMHREPELSLREPSFWKSKYCVAKVKQNHPKAVKSSKVKQNHILPVCDKCIKDPNCHFFANTRVTRQIIYQILDNHRIVWEKVSDSEIYEATVCKATIWYEKNMDKRTLNSAIISATEIINKKKAGTITSKTAVHKIFTEIMTYGFGNDDSTVKWRADLANFDVRQHINRQKSQIYLDISFVIIGITVSVMCCCMFVIGLSCGVVTHKVVNVERNYK